MVCSDGWEGDGVKLCQIERDCFPSASSLSVSVCLSLCLSVSVSVSLC